MQSNTPCSTTQHRNNWKTCEICAKRRQSRIADQAEHLSKQTGTLYLSVITPHENTANEIRRIRASLYRSAIAKAGIWTIETGTKFAQLHINIISQQPDFSKINHAKTWTEQIKTSPRDAAAYISKRTGAPSPEQYNGKLFGTWGQIGIIMADSHQRPIMQAAAINDILANPEKANPQRPPALDFPNLNDKKQLTRQEYRDLAHAHLATLYNLAHRAGIKQIH